MNEIGISAFENCFDLKSVTIPERVKRIEAYAFFNCKSLTEIEIPAGVESIKCGAFKNCHNLTRVMIHGEKLPEIGEEVFDGGRSVWKGEWTK